ncbi:hypothetical protein OIU91_43305 (plasmid) [Streptomyces sp. NBC_01456]|uniref:hypothetical protein n=1 Tax=unclassified Streptomyces TaxID=2593676 RepID=UPI002E2FBAF4|nr:MULTISPECIES: hypothetical protein [unclassified Streptomyces]
MTYETPRDGAGAKLCGWCGGPIKQSGVGRSRDYCTRLCRERAYRRRRDDRLIAEALADAAAVSSTRETVSSTGETTDSSTDETNSPVDETEVPAIPAPAEPAERPASSRRPQPRRASDVFQGLPKGRLF